jgi:hypothetical protein
MTTAEAATPASVISDQETRKSQTGVTIRYYDGSTVRAPGSARAFVAPSWLPEDAGCVLVDAERVRRERLAGGRTGSRFAPASLDSLSGRVVVDIDGVWRVGQVMPPPPVMPRPRRVSR